MTSRLRNRSFRTLLLLTKNTTFLITLFILVAPDILLAQQDSIEFKNSDLVVGDVKGLNRNVLTIETDYSDSDFKIEWNGVKKIKTQTFFLITLSNGTRYNGRLESAEDNYITVILHDGTKVSVKQNQIVMMDDIDQGFWSQLYASIDVGLDITKANNLRQLSTSSKIGYMANRWQLDGNINVLQSRQDDTDPIKRTDGGVTFKYFLPHDWYPMTSMEFLSNTEQQLKIRSSVKTGFGKYVVHTNRSYWGFSAGLNYNNEVYNANDFDDRSSWEGFIGTELNLFNMGDVDLLTQIIAYPSFTEKNRIRSDFNFTIKYDLPLDFYIKLGLTLNYDNQPASGSSETDYILSSGFGWEW